MEGKADALESTKPCGLLAGGASVVVIIVVIINATNFIYCGMGSFRMVECLVLDISVKETENFVSLLLKLILHAIDFLIKINCHYPSNTDIPPLWPTAGSPPPSFLSCLTLHLAVHSEAYLQETPSHPLSSFVTTWLRPPAPPPGLSIALPAPALASHPRGCSQPANPVKV